MSDSELLSVKNLNAGYESIQILFDVSLAVPRIGTLGIVGRNGAGKTTLLQTLVGYIAANSGEIWLADREVTKMSPSQRVRLGIGYVPQEGPVFSNLTVRENLVIGTSALPKSKRNDLDSALTLFPKLADRLDQKAGTMSGGERKMVGIARALLGEPQLLIMDEPTEGVWHGVVDEIRQRLAEYARDHSVLLVEQNLDFAMALADQIVLLELGRIVLSGSPQEVNKNNALHKRLSL